MAAESGPKLVFSVNNYVASFLIYDLKEEKLIKQVKNPSGKKFFLGSIPLHGLQEAPLTLIRDHQQVSLLNLNTQKPVSLLDSPFEVDNNRVTSYAAEV
jgi:hypothetical protein